MTEPAVQKNGAPEIRGEAGYETPYPYMERLQEKMEETGYIRLPDDALAREQEKLAQLPFPKDE